MKNKAAISQEITRTKNAISKVDENLQQLRNNLFRLSTKEQSKELSEKIKHTEAQIDFFVFVKLILERNFCNKTTKTNTTK